jgi:hypothetical protein
MPREDHKRPMYPIKQADTAARAGPLIRIQLPQPG